MAERNGKTQKAAKAKTMPADTAWPMSKRQTASPPSKLSKPTLSKRSAKSQAKQGSKLRPGEFRANTATRDQFMEVKGVGRVKAQRIVDERAARGDFKDFGDLQARVQGIGRGCIANLSDAGMVFW